MPEVTDDFKLGYALGLIVGEGSFTGDWRKPALQVKMHARDYAVLKTLQELFGGKVYGPYTHGDRYYCIWLLRGQDLKDAVPTFLRYLPSSYKREQFTEWIGKYFNDLIDMSH